MEADILPKISQKKFIFRSIWRSRWVVGAPQCSRWGGKQKIGYMTAKHVLGNILLLDQRKSDIYTWTNIQALVAPPGGALGKEKIPTLKNGGTWNQNRSKLQTLVWPSRVMWCWWCSTVCRLVQMLHGYSAASYFEVLHWDPFESSSKRIGITNRNTKQFLNNQKAAVKTWAPLKETQVFVSGVICRNQDQSDSLQEPGGNVASRSALGRIKQPLERIFGSSAFWRQRAAQQKHTHRAYWLDRNTHCLCRKQGQTLNEAVTPHLKWGNGKCVKEDAN